MQTQTTVVNWEEPTTWTNWQERFSVVAECVYTVVWDTDDQRRQLYGKAGAFREQPHGVEYRTLSNFWIFSKDLISEVYDRIQAAINHPLIETNSEEGKLIQQIINTNDKLSAKSYLQAAGL